MVCIYCSGETRVINSRHQKRENHIWRRRQCLNCNTVFTTEEAPDLAANIRVATPRQPSAVGTKFDRDKLFVSLYRALGHRQHAISDASALCTTIISKLLKTHSGAVLSVTEIAFVTNETLQHFDSAAAVSYAAYHSIALSE